MKEKIKNFFSRGGIPSLRIGGSVPSVQSGSNSGIFSRFLGANIQYSADNGGAFDLETLIIDWTETFSGQIKTKTFYKGWVDNYGERQRYHDDDELFSEFHRLKNIQANGLRAARRIFKEGWKETLINLALNDERELPMAARQLKADYAAIKAVNPSDVRLILQSYGDYLGIEDYYAKAKELSQVLPFLEKVLALQK